MSFYSIFGTQGAPLDEDEVAARLDANMSSLDKSPRSHLSSPCQNYSDDDFDVYPPSGKRLAPVGAASNEDEDMASKRATIASSSSTATSMAMMSISSNSSTINNELEDRLKQMEDDQEELNSSLMSLTSHFAKVCQSRDKKH
jgi:hypothetical protein